MKTVGTPRKKAAAAGPRKSRAAAAPRETVARELVEQALAVITTSLDEDKAEDIVTLDLRGRASFADHMVVATGIADRQIAAMASHIEDKLNEIGIKRITIEGANGTDWVLLDTGDIVVHLFKPESRALYALERMWGKDLDDSAADEADTTDL
ncbi:ribosome silencing factor [Asaia spathodeae]|uniref:ribosome silencing factor n=1 Tax=Asaia spathodeae TaxID=657016 RepID=UPI0038D1ED90